MTQHTPGPHGLTFTHEHSDAFGHFRCGCTTYDGGRALCPTHAAAPDMLEIIRSIASPGINHGAARALLAKIEGMTMTQHTPCGCTADYTDTTPSGYKYGEVKISYCPTHAAAPEMVAEIRELLAHAKYADGQAIVLTQDCEALEALLAKIEGR